MTDAKQEAQRIFERFYNETLSHLSDHITREDAIQSALICVDEILRNKLIISNIDIHYYYQDVQQELKNLRK